jgi:hypothetical protein
MPGNTENKNYDVFISYRTTHKTWVDILARNLTDQGFTLFLDSWELIPGQDFTQQIHAALHNSGCAILVATPDASDSGWVQQEYQTMFNLKNNKPGFFFIPVIFGRFPDFPFLDNVQAVDFSQSGEEAYRRAFHRLLCGLKQQAPGADGRFTGKLHLPLDEPAAQRQLAKKEKSFLDEVFTQLNGGVPVMILAQADSDTQILGHALRHKAEGVYGPANTLHIFPPNSTRADTAAYFRRLGQQCHIEQDIRESWEWSDALAKRLEGGVNLFLLVTGFENGDDQARTDLAGELRQLNERYPGLKILMTGGERLAALKYAHGQLSFLNIATELRLPELSARDLLAINSQRYPDLSLPEAQLGEILDFTGQHPRLLDFCLQSGLATVEEARQALENSPLPAQLFTRFREDADREPLAKLLQKTDVGAYDPWPAQSLPRRLYWNNLITRRGGRLAWRCEIIRQWGLRVLEC